MKKLISVFLAVIVAVGIFAVGTSLRASAADKIDPKTYTEVTYGSAQERLDAMVLMTSTETDELYVDPVTGEVGWKNLRTGEILLTNPYNLGTKDFDMKAKAKYLSQVTITYRTMETGTSTVMDSFNYAATYNQIDAMSIKQGIRVEYTFGETKVRSVLPSLITKARFDEMFIEPLDAAYAEKYAEMEEFLGPDLSLSYLTDKNGKNRLTSSNLTKFGREFGTTSHAYEMLSSLFELREAINLFNTDSIYKLYDVTGLDPEGTIYQSKVKACPICEYGPAYYANVANLASTQKAKMEKAVKLYTEYDYTQLDADNEYAGVEDTIAESVQFSLALEYRLTEDGLNVTLSENSISYDATKYIITSIAVLPYFGCGDRADNGYSFVPDGSGSLIRFEDIRRSGGEHDLKGMVYGTDYIMHSVTGSSSEVFRLPVFGLVDETQSEGTRGYVAVITEGDALATIYSEHTSNYNSVYPIFDAIAKDTYDFENVAAEKDSDRIVKRTVTAPARYTGDFNVLYKMLIPEDVAESNGLTDSYDTTYVGMAKAYRDYLTKVGTLRKIENPDENMPLFIETLGSVKALERIATIPFTMNKALTTFGDVKTIYDELSALNVHNMNFVLTGFANGGLFSTYPLNVKWLKVLGGGNGYSDLLAQADTDGFNVIADFDFVYSHARGNAFNRLSYKTYAAKSIDDRYCVKRVYNAATQMLEVSPATGGILISAAKYGKIYESFDKAISEYAPKYLGVGSLGTDVNSDFNEKDPYSREDTKDFTVEFLDKLASKHSLMVKGGNAYALPYTSKLIDVALDSSKFRWASESVPFTGMVFHGSLEFTGSAFNMEGNTEYAFMKAMENGAGLYFVTAYDNVEELKESRFSYYYSVKYEYWRDTIANFYTKYNDIMKDLQDQYIVDHLFVNDGKFGYSVHRETAEGPAVVNSSVVRVTYEDGTVFYLNYNRFDVVITDEGGNTFTIPYENYLIQNA